MKYFDKNTVKRNLKWQDREIPDTNNREEKLFKRKLRDFSLLLTGKYRFWWIGLDFSKKKKIYKEYCDIHTDRENSAPLSSYYWYSMPLPYPHLDTIIDKIYDDVLETLYQENSPNLGEYRDSLISKLV